MNDDNEFSFDSGSSRFDQLRPYVAYAAIGLFTAMSAATTFQFFATYAPGLGAWFTPNDPGLAAGIFGVLLLDLACLVWAFLSRDKFSTKTQQDVSFVTAVATLAGSLIVSFLYVVLSLDLNGAASQLASDGGQTLIGRLLYILAVVVMALAFSGNFAAAWIYSAKSRGAIAAEAAAKFWADETANNLTIEQVRRQREARSRLEKIQEQLPQLAATAGQTQATNYLSRHYGVNQPVAPWGGGESTPVETMLPPADQLRSRGEDAERFTMPGQQANPADGDGANFPPAR